MSTRNLKSVQGVTRRNGSAAIAAEVRARAEAVAAEEKKLEAAKKDADIAHAAEVQSINDDLAPLGEEKTQILAILGVTKTAKKDKDKPKDDDSKKKDKAPKAKPDDEEPKPKDKDKKPKPKDDDSKKKDKAPKAKPDDEEPKPKDKKAKKDKKVPPRVRTRWDPRTWTALERIVGVILAIVGIVIALLTGHGLLHPIGVDWHGPIMIVIATIIKAVLGIGWVIIWMLVGFYGGAWLVFAINRRIHRNDPPPTAPAA